MMETHQVGTLLITQHTAGEFDTKSRRLMKSNRKGDAESGLHSTVGSLLHLFHPSPHPPIQESTVLPEKVTNLL